MRALLPDRKFISSEDAVEKFPPVFLEFKAISVSSLLASRLKQENRPGKIHSVFRRSLYWIQRREKVTAIVAKESGNVPHGILIDFPHGFDLRDVGVLPDEPVYPTFEQIILPKSGVIFSLKGAKLWPAAPSLPIKAAPPQLITDNLETIRTFLSRNSARSGLAPLFVYFTDLKKRGSPLPFSFDPLCRQAFVSIRSFYSGLWNLDLKAVRDGFLGLIGLGTGLTPSGDDVLIGSLGTLAVLEKPDPLNTWIHRVGETVAELAKGRTTLLSAAYLRYASKGLIPEVLFDLVTAAACGSTRKLLQACHRIMGVGDSSGIESTFGCFLAMNFVGDGFKNRIWPGNAAHRGFSG